MPKLKLNEFNDELDKESGRLGEKQFVEEIAEKNTADWLNRGHIQVLGLAVEKYLTSSGYSDTEESHDINAERYKLIVKDLKNKNKYLIGLSESYGSSYSGYSTASYGHIKIERLEKDIPLSHIPTEPTIITGFSINPDDLSWEQQTIYKRDKYGNIARDKAGEAITDAYCSDDSDERENIIKNNVFTYTHSGTDAYYPTGFVNVNKKLFTPLARAMENRPIWIIEGASGTGKSTLASHLQGLTVFETDSVDELPEVIKADVIVLGNRSGFKRDDVTKRIFGQPNVEIIGVSFDKTTEQRDYLQEKMEALKINVHIKNQIKKREARRNQFGKDYLTNAELRNFESEYEAAGKNLKLGKTSGSNGKETADIQTKAAKREMRNHRVINALRKSQKENCTNS